MVKQVGPAQGKPTTMLALVAAVIDWLPCARIPSWPGAPRCSIREAEDTFAVRPLRLRSELSPHLLHQLQQWRAATHPARANLAPRVQPPLRPERLPPERFGLRPVFLTGAPKGARSGRGSAPAPRPPPSFTLTEESRYPLLGGCYLGGGVRSTRRGRLAASTRTSSGVSSTRPSPSPSVAWG